MKKKLGVLVFVSVLNSLSSSCFAGPIHVAFRSGDTAEVLRLIHANVAHVEAVDESQNRPLFLAARDGHKEIALALIAAGAKVSAVGQSGATPLHAAVLGGHKEIVQALMDAHADVNAYSRDGRTPLHMAAWKDRAEIARMLIAAGADVNSMDQRLSTPLHWAASFGSFATAQVLICAGANPSATDERQLKPFQLAKRNPDLVDMCRPEAVTKFHTQVAIDHVAVGNHELAAQCHTWAGEALPETPEAAASHTQAAEIYSRIGNYTAAATSYTAAGQYIAAAASYIALQDFRSATQSYASLFRSIAARAEGLGDPQVDENKKAEGRAVQVLEVAAVDAEAALLSAIERVGEPGADVKGHRSLLVRILDAIEQVHADAAEVMNEIEWERAR